MLQLLPPEIALDTISYLLLPSLYSTALVSSNWNALIAINEATVYRNAALLHRFVTEGDLHADSTSLNPKFRRINWKAYCQRQFEIERGWLGKAPPTIREFTATGTAVHRIKTDEEYGFVITTCQTGGLSVTDATDNRVLWALPPSHVVEYAHCEYDRGYIIFNRRDNGKEVWRRSIDVGDGQVSATSPPDSQMLQSSTEAAARFHMTADRRGHFRAWALLQMPEITRAFRFSYPTMLASATNNAYIWDVPRSKLVEVIRDIQRPRNGSIMGRLNYVEVNDRYAFICGSTQLRIFSREGGALVYQLSTKDLPDPVWDVLRAEGGSGGASTAILEPQMLHKTYHDPRWTPMGEFMACVYSHVSASGNDLVALTSSGRVVIIPDFERLFSGSDRPSFEDIATQLNFRPTSGEWDVSLYLAVGDRNRKLAVATRKGIYAISPDLRFSSLTAEHPPNPGVSVCRLSQFDSDRLLSFISCLQVTHSAIYFNYKPSQRNGRRGAHQQGLITLHAAEDDIDVQEMPALQPAIPGEEAFLDEDDNPPMPEFDDEFMDEDFHDFPEDDPVHVIVNGEDNEVVHHLIDDWFLPVNMSTVYRVSF
ncbi:hypothetical protein PAXRUDRAFT_828041 [Paxillus rubicundulus Ve08.2h10]|uniref:F-box domain-containing protein n=1 Tax=Paxillus rubicundulus Ve08.2h10 TaxID=930991 RepID=A0A0D0DB74_9AGAM|nr:hypothetical protein PAXRUDRAFT_828041 [Paxillus rubicundulus Ve08.2h10]